MSWLTGLAGKAEDLLNKVDKQAAKTLNTLEEEAHAPNNCTPQTVIFLHSVVQLRELVIILF